MQLAFFTSSLQSYVDYGFPEGTSGVFVALARCLDAATVVSRAFTPTSKAVICKSPTSAFQECQEAMGGVGYIGKLFSISRSY